MGIAVIEIKRREVAEEVWALQHPAYRIEAALIGVPDLPPLQDTIQSLQACGEIFIGFRNEEGELLGAVSYERERLGDLTICRLMVHPDYLRQGIATRMLEYLFSDQRNLCMWSVMAEIRNLPAIALYERLGFVRHETFKPIAGIEMVKLIRLPSRL
ncbi:GNAT family N-acetyltransferase [Cohnella mopanensis]|uniref:GNAT family N-acetyltransferase n=1 Tax=Cohnella mopanensis TaxID=2911966 RepID=UPI001EF87B90|nr:GNAT family N-acetyltransferase [Cohnella mopanensis]